MTQVEKVTIVLADDHVVVREGVRALLDRDEEIEVIGVASSGVEAVTMVESLLPDVAVLDVSMKESSGLDAAREIKSRFGVGVLMLSMHDDPEYVYEAVAAGADGYVLKDSDPMELRRAVKKVAEGGEVFNGAVAERLAQGARSHSARLRKRERLETLTAREVDVLLEVAKGSTNREIAATLSISPRTVETHRERVMGKLGVRSIAGLTRLVMENGEALESIRSLKGR